MITNHEAFPKTHSIFYFLNKEVEELEIKLINFLLRAGDLQGVGLTVRHLVDPRDKLGGKEKADGKPLPFLLHGDHPHTAEELGPREITPSHLQRQLDFLLTRGELEKNGNRLVEPVQGAQFQPRKRGENAAQKPKKI